MISIRQADDGDIETLCELLCASIRELCSADHKNDAELIERWTANKTPEHLAHWISDPRLSLFLAERDEQVAGVGCMNEVAKFYSTMWRLLTVFVASVTQFWPTSRQL